MLLVEQWLLGDRMTASAQDSDRTLLLILPAKKEMFPLSTAALTRAQASRRELANDYRDALVLDRDGTLRRIERIEVVGPWGNSVGRKLLSRLTDAWQIAVRLSEPLPWQLAELKQLLADCINAHGNMGDPETDEASRQRIAAAVLAASSADQIFDVLKVPPPEEALDVL